MTDEIIQFPAIRQGMSPLARRLASEAEARQTARAYAADWRAFDAWLTVRRLPADGATLADYVAARAAGGIARATLKRNVSGILATARAAGDPIDGAAAARVVRGAARSGIAAYGRGRARPITARMLGSMLDAMDRADGADPVRDRALVLTGWHAALRASEIVGLHWHDYRHHGGLLGSTLSIRHSKGARTGDSVNVPIVATRDERYCPIRALDALPRPPGEGENAPIFTSTRGVRRGSQLTPESVSHIVRRWIRAAGMATHGFSAHSLRAGYITTAAAAGVPSYRLMEHSRHKSTVTLDHYVRDIKAMQDHPSRIIGL